MSNETEKIDALIKDALTQEERKFYDELDEQNIFQMFSGLFNGKLKWLVIIMQIDLLIFFGMFVYSTIQFFNTDVTNEMLIWGALGFFSMLVLALLKIFFWMQMNKNSTKRDLKRIELQISILSSKLEK